WPHHAEHRWLQPVQVRLRRRLRLAQHRRSVPSGQFLRRACGPGRNHRTAHGRAPAFGNGRSPGESRRPDGCVGRREYPRIVVRRYAAEGDVRRQRTAHQSALLRRLGVRRGHAGEPGLGQDRLREGGGDRPPPAGKAPTFMVWAVKDPTSGNLDRIQIVKGWTQSGQSFEKIFDVAWAGARQPAKWTGKIPPIGSTVDVDEATYTNTIGAVELKTVWTDPEFDPSLDAFYYPRVLEIPTPRW